MPALTSVRSSGSAFTNSDKKSSGFISAIKNAFKPNKSDKSKSSRGRRYSVMSIGSTDRSALKEEAELEKRRANCLAIKTAKREPLELQKLLVDCEFCNPPDDFAQELDLDQYFSDLPPAPLDSSVKTIENPDDEMSWNTGLQRWTKMRDWWTTPGPDRQLEHHLPPDFNKDKYFVVYDRMVRRGRPPQVPLNLEDVVAILKAGWVGEGTWPKVEDPDDKWSDLDSANDASDANCASTNPSRGQTPRPSPGPSQQTSTTTGTGTLGKVMFNDQPHPKLEINTHDGDEDSGRNFNALTRVQSNMSGRSLSLAPTRSNRSSVISLTDED